MRIRPSTLLPSALLVATLALLSPLSAQTTAVSNVSQTTGTGVGVGKSGSFDFIEAFNFTTGAGTSTFSSVTILSAGTNGAPTGFTLALWSNVSSGGPSGLLSTLSGSSQPSGTASYTYTSGTPLTLAASTTYWLVASAPTTAANTSFGLQGTPSTSEDAGGLAGWLIGNTRMVSNDGGATWLVSTNIPLFSIQTAIPEPSTCAVLSGTAALLMAGIARRRRG